MPYLEGQDNFLLTKFRILLTMLFDANESRIHFDRKSSVQSIQDLFHAERLAQFQNKPCNSKREKRSYYPLSQDTRKNSLHLALLLKLFFGRRIYQFCDLCLIILFRSFELEMNAENKVQNGQQHLACVLIFS